MTKSQAVEELERVRKYFRNIEIGQTVKLTQYDASRYRRRIDEAIDFVKANTQ